MLKTVPQIGAKIRCINNGECDFMTTGKIYEVLGNLPGGFRYYDDDGDILFHNFSIQEGVEFELVEGECVSIKIGDFVKLKEWDDFLEVTSVDHVLQTIELVEEGIYRSRYPISLGFIKQGDEMREEKQVVQKQDEFQVGDEVWSTVYGKGKVVTIDSDIYCIGVKSDIDEGFSYYTRDGKYDMSGPRTLFFSEPKIEAAVTRPFVSTLVGKKVVVQYFDETWSDVVTIIKEEPDTIYYGSNGYDSKVDLIQILEVQSENLLKK